MPETIEDTLKDRGIKYGDFTDHARISQDLKQVMIATPAWQRLSPDKREALEMVQHKIARILNGNAEYIDSYRDIVGYTQLVIDKLKSTDGSSDAITKNTSRVNGAWPE